MENSTFWAFFVIALIGGLTLGIAYTNSITGKAIFDIFKGSATVSVGNQTNQTNITTKCIDSDGGIKIYTKGTVVGAQMIGKGNETYCNYSDGKYICTDYCISSNRIREFYCVQGTSEVAYVEYQCSFGCYNGVCLKNQSNQTQPEPAALLEELPEITVTEYPTYQGVLDMLNNCVALTIPVSNLSCTEMCRNWNKGTCILTIAESLVSERTTIINCNTKFNSNIFRSMDCLCCSPPTSTNRTANITGS